MSNYTISVDWAGKNALSDSDAAKIISGTDFNTEFTTVQTAINSKSNLNGNSGEDFSINNGTVAGTLAITGVPTGPTQSAGNNTTRLATTAFVTTAVANNYAFPVGAIFTTTVAYANSAAVVTAIGGTTWTSFGAGKVLLGLDSSDTDFDTVEETGGAKTDSHTLTTAETPAHTHNLTQLDYAPGGGGTFNSQTLLTGATNSYGSNAGSITGDIGDTDSAGGGGAHTHDIVQPYIVVYFWKRTA